MNIKLDKVMKKYGDKEVITNLNLEVKTGELVSLVGPSGCGKSTTLFMLSGLEEVSGGKIYFEDKDVTSLSADKRDVGLVFQNYALYPHLSVLKNVMFPLSNKKIDKEKATKMAMEIIQSVDLAEHANKLPGQLSGGQQQRVAIARAIVKNPNVLLLDEPLSNLDAKLKMSTILEIKRIQRAHNITTIFVTHDQQEALAISDKMVVLNEGVVQQAGLPNQLYRDPNNLFVAQFIGSPSINTFISAIKNGYMSGLENLTKDALDIPCGDYTVAIRPEAFQLATTGVDFSIKEREVLGRDVLLYGTINGVDMRILVSNTQLEYDETVTNIKVIIDTTNILLFDKDTKERIRYEK